MSDNSDCKPSRNSKGNRFAKIRVLHVINRLDHGGAELYTYRIIKHMDGECFEHVVAYARGGLIEDRFREISATLYKISDHGLNFRNPCVGFAAMVRLGRYLRSNDIDVIHSPLFEPYFWVCLVARWFRIPLVRTVTGIRRDAQPWVRVVERLFATLTARFVVFNRISKEEMLEFGVDECKLSVIPNAIAFKESDAVSNSCQARVKSELGIRGRKIVGSVCRLHWHKNPEMFLTVAKYVCEEHDSVKFILEGDGPLREEMEEISRKFELDGAVIFTGWSKDLPALMSLFDIFVLTSVTDCSPTVVLEAMALGIPVIATSVGGVPEMVRHGSTGLLVESGDAKKMASQVVRLLANPEEAERLGESGREFCKNTHDIMDVVPEVSNVYRECTGE